MGANRPTVAGPARKVEPGYEMAVTTSLVAWPCIVSLLISLPPMKRPRPGLWNLDGVEHHCGESYPIGWIGHYCATPQEARWTPLTA